MDVISGRMGSVLNPDAAPYVPGAYRAVEDFSAEWWELVHSSPWFRDYRLRECFHEPQNDPDSFDIHDPALPDDIDYHDVVLKEKDWEEVLQQWPVVDQAVQAVCRVFKWMTNNTDDMDPERLANIYELGHNLFVRDSVAWKTEYKWTDKEQERRRETNRALESFSRDPQVRPPQSDYSS